MFVKFIFIYGSFKPDRQIFGSTPKGSDEPLRNRLEKI